MSVEEFREEVAMKQRFEFGKNWKHFLESLSDSQIEESEKGLTKLLGANAVNGKTFLDIGSGSGLSSLAAKRLGATVTSFDFDEASVWCTNELKSRYFADDDRWIVQHGSALDVRYLETLGVFDIVYSWGVLHHTGEMWRGIDNATRLVKDDGLFFIAIYNDQGFKSHFWWMVKYFYTHLPRFLRKPFAYSAGSTMNLLMLIKYTLKLKPMFFLGPLLNYKTARGMSLWHDMVDWYGGFPFEFATYDRLRKYIENKGFELINGNEVTSLGCHELVFRRKSP